MLTLFAFLSCSAALHLVIASTRVPKLPIYTAFLSRLLLALLFQFEFLPIPHSDHYAFQRLFSQFSYQDWDLAIKSLLTRPGSSSVFPNLGAIVYKLFGIQDSFALVILFSIFFGCLSVIFTFLLSELLFGRKRARQVTWVAVFFPFTLITSSILLREALGAASMTLGLYYVARSYHHQEMRKSSGTLAAIICFVMASWIHGGYSFALIGMVVLILWDLVEISIDPVKKMSKKRFISTIIGAIFLFLLSFYLITSQLSLGKIGNIFETIANADEVVDSQLARDARGGSAYPSFAQQILPVRLVYFLFSPFPWDIRSPRMAFGFIATITFVYILISVIMGFKGRQFQGRKDVLAITIILAISILPFAIGTSNIGTSIRHRSKFIYGLLALSPPLVSKSRKSRLMFRRDLSNPN